MEYSERKKITRRLGNNQTKEEITLGKDCHKQNPFPFKFLYSRVLSKNKL